MSIRNLYAEFGVDNYYSKYSKEYINYHFNELKFLLENNIDRIINDKNTKILDLCCGNGEVTKILLNLNIKNIIGCDPYMNKIYEKNFNRKCYDCSFKDIIKGNLDGIYKIVICSFGLHLCEEKMLFNLLNMLKYVHGMERLVIITPNKKPHIKDKITHEFIYNKVRLRIYE